MEWIKCLKKFREEKNWREGFEKPKRPIFTCVMSSTETAKIPGISAAGSSPELTDYTPAGDAELVMLGDLRSVPELPMTPTGAPTPALITRAALSLIHVPILFIDAGVKIKPKIPVISIGAKPGGDIRRGKAVPEAREIYESAILLGKQLSLLSDFLVIGETIPGGTTTALGVLQALGCNGVVSSSFAVNPIELKYKAVEQGMKACGIVKGDLRNKPIEAISCLGDPMLACVLGLLKGIEGEACRVVLAGGTQMMTILALAKHMNIKKEISIATTKYIASDGSANFIDFTRELAEAIYIVDPGFGESKLEELHGYERGEIKEGVGAGGAIFLAGLMGIEQVQIRSEIERIYCKFKSRLKG
ncbi:MAG: TIGR00303 family protein [Methanocellales archaeon]